MDTFYQSLNALSEGLFSRRSFVGALAVGGALGLEAWRGAQAFGDGGSADASQAPARQGRSLIPPYATPSVVEESDAVANAKRVLIVIDYQVDFVDGGAFGTVEPAMAIEEALCEVIRRYRDNGDIVIYTMDTHPSDHYLETREGTFNPPHCIPGTDGWELYGSVRDLLTPENAILVKKGTYGSRDLPMVLKALQHQGITIESIEFAGVSTTCRVLHNAIIVYNFFPELPLIFDERTTASYTDEATAQQLNQLEGWGFIVKRG
ncbi:cysteine hydrolase family protein [uncultured Adlercreutzia sp.]|uniref:cysteine hydrolase family protein n=1 Tax=uncultured Adlercreutzia sp. TaxID=875803 RepID=UPI002674922B|nr:isochorismatase family cysteine hydrolase [uncultured Adlercreutzia sp.]